MTVRLLTNIGRLWTGTDVCSTVAVTRGTDPWTLCNGVRERLRQWILAGTTTVEAKTGYHLTRDGELADIRLLRSLEGEPAMPRIHATFLAAHVLPPEFFGRRRDYIEAVRLWAGDAAAAGADSIDVYCDDGHFTPDEARALLVSGKRVGLKARIHACATERMGAPQVAAEVGCASADLLTEANDDDIKALAHGGVTATVCPGSALHTRRTPPVRAMLDRGVTLALGTDHNPGQCGITSMPLVIGLSVAMFGLSVTEALRAATMGGAAALRVGDRGQLAPGMCADMVLWDADHEGAFAWAFGLRALRV